MTKIQAVRLLNEGDLFEFLEVGVAQHLKGLMMVTRAPRVNMAANSCFFRYRPVAGESIEMHSWNGPPDGKVQVPSAPATEAAPPATVASPTEPVAPRPAAKKKTVKKPAAKEPAVTKRAVPEPAKKAAAKKVTVKKAPAKKLPAKAAKKAKRK